MFCYQCGAPLPDDARFCSKCGAQMRPAEPVEQVPVPEAALPEEPEPGRVLAVEPVQEPVPVLEPEAFPEPEPAPEQPTQPELSEDEREIQANVAMTVGDIIREEMEQRQQASAAFAAAVVAGARQPESVQAPGPAQVVQPQSGVVPVRPLEPQPVQSPAPVAETAVRRPSGTGRKALRAVLWILIVLIFAAAEIWLFFFAEVTIGGTLFQYAVMACVLVVCAALFLIVGIACAVPKNRT